MEFVDRRFSIFIIVSIKVTLMHIICSLKLIVCLHFFIEMTYSTGEINETRLFTLKYKYEWMFGSEIMEYRKTSLHYSNSYDSVKNRRDNKKDINVKI